MPARKAERIALRLRLYVAGNSPNSVRAEANTRALCLAHFPGVHELEIVDLLTHPDRAHADQVIVTPTLIRLAPAPPRRAIGSLSDAAGVLSMLNGA
jgi:circadian clock protein KaiB